MSCVLKIQLIALLFKDVLCCVCVYNKLDSIWAASLQLLGSIQDHTPIASLMELTWLWLSCAAETVWDVMNKPFLDECFSKHRPSQTMPIAGGRTVDHVGRWHLEGDQTALKHSII